MIVWLYNNMISHLLGFENIWFEKKRKKNKYGHRSTCETYCSDLLMQVCYSRLLQL